ncbi:Toll-like receptor 2 type-2 [Amphibalanus amphitrite]|uniref:Toll-like receptor 2 type-2 n=1 Tax=Amphibalanus amphitrite TaxID=1232801 RepID=A0A6A4VSL6_AMPAM|nr:Toll-like receptor 2 type-2 [Amphibalanus amphitrite]
MLVKLLAVAALALFLCSQHSAESPSTARPPLITGTTDPLRSYINREQNKTSAENRTSQQDEIEGSSGSRAAEELDRSPELRPELDVEVKPPQKTASVNPVFSSSPNKRVPHVSHGESLGHLLDTISYDGNVPQLGVNHKPFHVLEFADVNDGPPPDVDDVLDASESALGARSQETDLVELLRLTDRRFLPLMLMGDPEPVGRYHCTYDKPQPIVQSYVDAFDDNGCASCELDDEGRPIKEYSEDITEFLPSGFRPEASEERLRELFQAGLLDKDTFSAEDRPRGALRRSSPTSTNCTCSVGDQETICSSGGAGLFCDQLPYTTVPSGILEVSHTNISELDVGSLEFVANVSVLRLAWNEVARVQPGVFANMSLLKNLSLAHNRLDMLDVKAFSGATALQEVVLSYNMFTELTHATQALNVKTTPRLVHLNIGGNNFSQIGPQDFESLSQLPIEDLQLHENNIEHIDPTTFIELKHLRRLRLRNNFLPIEEVAALVNEMNNTTLEVIDLSMIGKYSISELNPVLSAVADSNITSLMLNDYCFPSIYGVWFPGFPGLKELSMRSCGISYIYANSFNQFTALESLDLRDNYFTYVPAAVLLSSLVSLDLSRPELRKYTGAQKPSFSVSQYRFREMTSLKYLDLSYNNITVLERGAFVGLENLTVLLLKETELEHIANFSFSMLENLSELHLTGNYLGAQPFEHLWQGLTCLTVLFLDHCRINTSQLYLSEMPRTEILNLSGNALRTLTPNTFHGLSYLNTIDLSDNIIESWEESIFRDSRALERVYLRSNGITWISSAMAEDFMLLNLRVLMLGHNPYHCSCHLHDWLDGQDDGADIGTVRTDWLLSKDKNGGYITNDIDDCYCSSPLKFSNETVLEFFLHADLLPCAEPSRTRILLTMLPVFVSGMWQCGEGEDDDEKLGKGGCWGCSHQKRWLKRLRKSNEGFLYDAFVSYSSEDASFVSEMIEQLEKTPPFYRLCVYERDFEIGNVISECILESINTSRKSILVLTDHFAKSHWCRWEMNLVQCRLFEQTRDDLILVKLGKIRSRHLTPTIRYLMRTRIYIEWGPSAQQQLLFWERLRAALKKPGGTPELPRTV